MKELGRGKRIHNNIFYICLLGIAFFLPVYGRLVPPFIVIMVVNWLVDAPFIRNFKRLFSEKQRLYLFSFSFLYLLYLLCMSYSSNIKYGLDDLEIKLSMLVFPLVFSTMDKDALPRERGYHILTAYVAGCLTGTLILLAHSWYIETWDHLQDAFYYGKLSWFFHSTYLSMYLAFSIAIITWYIIFGNIRYPFTKILLICLCIFFLIFIVLLSSKAGILSLALVMVLFSSFPYLRKRNWIISLVFLVTSFLLLYLGLQFFPYASLRITSAGKSISEKEHITGDNKESTAERLQIWKSAYEIIRDHPILGIGTGDVKDELMAKYKERNILVALERKLNAHNQYIQTYLATGLLGFLMLLGMLFLPIIPAFRNEHYLYIVFLLIFLLNFAFESMLEVQAGVVFYAFFNAFFFWRREGDQVALVAHSAS
jgi:O-antigen ligase